MPRKKKGAVIPPAPEPAAAPPPDPQVQPVIRVTDPVVPQNAEGVIHNVMLRQLADDQAHPPPPIPACATVAAMRELVEVANTKREISSKLRERLQVLTSNNNEMLKVMSGLMLRHQFSECVAMMEDRHHLKEFLRRCLRRADLTPAEALVFLNYTNTELRKSVDLLNDRIKIGVGETDIDGFSAKYKYTLEQAEPMAEEEIERLDEATPQGLEIIRRLTYGARQGLKEKIKESRMKKGDKKTGAA